MMGPRVRAIVADVKGVLFMYVALSLIVGLVHGQAPTVTPPATGPTAIAITPVTVPRSIGVVASGRSVGAIAAVSSVTAYTPTVDTSLEISGNVNVTTHSTESFNLQVTYTDESNTARTVTWLLDTVAGTGVTAINAAGPFHAHALHIRAKANTAVTVLTSGSFTGATYNVEAFIRKLG